VTARLSALLVLATTAVAAYGQVPGRLRHEGSELFRFALHQHKIEPLTDPDQAMHDPPGSIIVVVGQVGQLNDLLTGGMIKSYLENGGAILIATDGPSPPPGTFGDWAQRYGIWIAGKPLTADAQNCYKRHPGRPFVRPLPRVERVGPSPFDLFAGVTENGPAAVATDYPSEMTIDVRPLGGKYLVKYLARYPVGTRRMIDNVPLDPDRTYFAISIEPQFADTRGRMIVLADQGVFFNGMMGFVKDDNDPRGYHFDNGNWGFTNRTIEWLQGGDRKPRTRCLFVEDGRVIDQFAATVPNTGKSPIPRLPPDVLANGVLNAMNPVIDAAQDRNFFNRMVESWLGFPRIVRIFVLTATILFLLACLRRLIGGRRRPEPAAVMTPQVQAGLLPRGGVLRQRTAAQIEVGNLYDAARRRVRERFDVLGGRPGREGQIPPVLTANDLPDGPVLHHSIRWLWALGYGVTPIRIPPADWDRTNVLLERVTARAARGDWSFGQEA